MRNKAVYLAIGVTCVGVKEVLGLWIEQTEGVKFWMRVMTELRGRGTTDILIAVIDGLKGFLEAITAVFPETVVQTCIVHLIRPLLRVLARGPPDPLHHQHHREPAQPGAQDHPQQGALPER